MDFPNHASCCYSFYLNDFDHRTCCVSSFLCLTTCILELINMPWLISNEVLTYVLVLLFIANDVSIEYVYHYALNDNKAIILVVYAFTIFFYNSRGHGDWLDDAILLLSSPLIFGLVRTIYQWSLF
jgi:hypothetical protein